MVQFSLYDTRFFPPESVEMALRVKQIMDFIETKIIIYSCADSNVYFTIICFKNIQTLNLPFFYGLTKDLTTFLISAERTIFLRQSLSIKFCTSEPGGNVISVPQAVFSWSFSPVLFQASQLHTPRGVMVVQSRVSM